MPVYQPAGAIAHAGGDFPAPGLEFEMGQY